MRELQLLCVQQYLEHPIHGLKSTSIPTKIYDKKSPNSTTNLRSQIPLNMASASTLFYNTAANAGVAGSTNSVALQTTMADILAREEEILERQYQNLSAEILSEDPLLRSTQTEQHQRSTSSSSSSTQDISSGSGAGAPIVHEEDSSDSSGMSSPRQEQDPDQDNEDSRNIDEIGVVVEALTQQRNLMRRLSQLTISSADRNGLRARLLAHSAATAQLDSALGGTGSNSNSTNTNSSTNTGNANSSGRRNPLADANLSAQPLLELLNLTEHIHPSLLFSRTNAVSNLNTSQHDNTMTSARQQLNGLDDSISALPEELALVHSWCDSPLLIRGMLDSPNLASSTLSDSIGDASISFHIHNSEGNSPNPDLPPLPPDHEL